MWILKSLSLGMWLFGFGTIVFLYFAIYRNLPPNSAVSVNLITALTIQNPVWWASLAVCLALGSAVVRSWSAPPILWNPGDRIGPGWRSRVVYRACSEVKASQSKSLTNLLLGQGTKNKATEF